MATRDAVLATILFWSAPPPAESELVLEDPLAIDHVAQQVGNWLWPGFTTRTSRAGYYVMACKGLALAHELAAHHSLPPNDPTIRSLFERWERLWALAACESAGGELRDLDAIRGSRGVARAHAEMRGRLTLDYKLISRQLELAALGAYLTSLRDHGLVSRDALRLTPLGQDLAARAWDDEGGGSDLDEFAREALAPGADEIPARVGRVTVASFGARCRLSSVRQRPALQARMSALLFDDHAGAGPLAHLPLIVRARVDCERDGRTELPAFLAHVATWSGSPEPLRIVARVGIALGEISGVMASVFDRTHQHVQDAGMSARTSEVIAALSTDVDRRRLSEASAAWHAVPEASAMIGRLDSHGPALVECARRLSDADPGRVLDAVLDLHARVQRDRGKPCCWIRRDGEHLVLEQPAYRPGRLDATEWVVGYKHAALRSLLADLGRIP